MLVRVVFRALWGPALLTPVRQEPAGLSCPVAARALRRVLVPPNMGPSSCFLFFLLCVSFLSFIATLSFSVVELRFLVFL